MAGLWGRRRRRKWLLIGALCALAVGVSGVYAVQAIPHGGLQPTDTVTLLGFPLGVVGIVLAVMALRKPVEGNDAELARGWASTLAKQVETGESAAWRQLLGDDTRRINLAYVLRSTTVRSAAAPAAGRLTADGPSPATLPDIVTYYRSTTRPRTSTAGSTTSPPISIPPAPSPPRPPRTRRPPTSYCTNCGPSLDAPASAEPTPSSPPSPSSPSPGQPPPRG